MPEPGQRRDIKDMKGTKESIELVSGESVGVEIDGDTVVVSFFTNGVDIIIDIEEFPELAKELSEAIAKFKEITG